VRLRLWFSHSWPSSAHRHTRCLTTFSMGYPVETISLCRASFAIVCIESFHKTRVAWTSPFSTPNTHYLLKIEALRRETVLTTLPGHVLQAVTESPLGSFRFKDQLRSSRIPQRWFGLGYCKKNRPPSLYNMMETKYRREAINSTALIVFTVILRMKECVRMSDARMNIACLLAERCHASWLSQ